MRPLCIFSTVIAFVLLLAGCGRPPEQTKAGPRPFIERVQPSDYLSAESLFGEAFSRSHDVVFLRTDSAQPVSVLALRREASGEHTVTFATAPLASGEPWTRFTTTIDAAIGQQVTRAIELKLHLGIALAQQRRSVSKDDSNLWIHQRLADGRVAAGLIPFEVTVGNADATVLIDDLLGRLQKLVGAAPEARATLLVEIDQIASKIVLASGKG